MRAVSNEAMSRLEMSKKPDKNLQLLGEKPTVWERPGYLTNSELTLTSRRLSQTSLYSPDNYRDSGRQRTAHNARSTMTSPQDKKSVTFNGSAPTLTNGITNGELSSTNSDASVGSRIRSKSRSNSAKSVQRAVNNDWYTSPLHRKDSARINGDHHSPDAQRTKSAIENLVREAKLVREFDRDHTLTQDQLTDALASQFFPTTLSAAYTISAVEPPPPASPPPRDLPRPDPEPWIPGAIAPRRRKAGHRQRPGSGHSSSSSASRGSVDKMYLMTAEAPAIGSSTVLLSSPFQCELAQLRMERLRIEENHLLEVKRQEELERIRGPQPRWYEMKSPRFHYEAHKNTELLRSRDDWQALLDYRRELERASKQYKQTQSGGGTS